MTGEKVYTYTNATYVNKQGKVVPKTTKSVKGAEVKDARLLTSAYDSKGRRVGSSTPIEELYADHSNRLKSLANQARKEMVSTKTIPYSPSAKKVYELEVARLNAKLNVALKNAPLERQAQLIANTLVKQKMAANPNMTPEEIKKLKGRSLVNARAKIGAGKTLVDITDREWEAIQAGAISNNKLTQILNNSDLDKLKQLATPRTPTVMTKGKQAQAKSLLNSGRTPSEVADILGVPLSTLTSSLE